MFFLTDQDHPNESLYPVAPITAAPSESVLSRNQSTEVIQKYIQGYRSVRTQLAQYMDPENGLLWSLLGRGVLTETVYNEFDRAKPYKQLNEDLMKVLTPKLLETCCTQFIDSLVENEQEHIVKFILTSGTNSDDDRVLKKEEIDVINNNMFGLVILIDPNRMCFLYRLVQYNCITDTHKERVASCQQNDKKVDQLLTILKRRRYRDFCNFKKCLNDTMQNKIVDLLDKGGLVAVCVKLREREDRVVIETKIIDLLTGYVNEKKEPTGQLSAEQINIIKDILKEMENSEWSIRVIGCAPWQSIAMYFQCPTEHSYKAFLELLRSGRLKDILERVFHCLLNSPEISSELITNMYIIESFYRLNSKYISMNR